MFIEFPKICNDVSENLNQETQPKNNEIIIDWKMDMRSSDVIKMVVDGTKDESQILVSEQKTEDQICINIPDWKMSEVQDWSKEIKDKVLDNLDELSEPDPTENINSLQTAPKKQDIL